MFTFQRLHFQQFWMPITLDRGIWSAYSTLWFTIVYILVYRMNEITAVSPMVPDKYSSDWPGLKVRLLVFDFDGTCTVEDTTGLYFKATDRYRSASEMETKTIKKEWGFLANNYLKGHHEIMLNLLDKIPPVENGDVNMEGLKSFLNKVHNFDMQSSEKVEASGLLAGISKEAIAEISRKVTLRPGCISVLEQFNIPLHIISFNWSKDLIRNVLEELKHLKIVGNSFPTVNDRSTGRIDNHVSSSSDKEIEFTNLVASQEQVEGFSVYIGDSIGDFLALLKADIGIVIGGSTTMRKVSRAFGIKFLPLFDLYNRYDHGNCHSIPSDGCISTSDKPRINKILYETNSWKEIGEVLLGKGQIANTP